MTLGGNTTFTQSTSARLDATGVIDVSSGQLDLPADFVNQGVVIDSSVVRVSQI